MISVYVVDPLTYAWKIPVSEPYWAVPTFNIVICSFTVVKRLAVSNTKKGQIDVRWDNSLLPAGQYTIQLEQDGSKSLFVEKLY